MEPSQEVPSSHSEEGRGHANTGEIKKGPYYFGVVVYCVFILLFIIWAMVIIYVL